MLLYLILLYLSRNPTYAASVTLLGRGKLDASIPSGPSTCTCPDQRSLLDILWSCLATIFACSWVSVHPNIPGPDESRMKIASRRLELMFWAVVAPEMIIYWAVRQWIGARKLARKWERQGWTRTHGYFIQMGGFMLYKGDQAKGVLSPEQLEELFSRGKIKFPIVTEKEIKDRSKADALSKTIVIGQTTWFMLQCIARAFQGLDITQLELLTVALAFLNAFMYFFWWNKPLDVQTPVPVYLSDVDLKEPQRAQDEPQKSRISLDRALRAASDPSLSVSFTNQPSDFVATAPLPASDHGDETADPLLTSGASSSPILHQDQLFDHIPIAPLAPSHDDDAPSPSISLLNRPSNCVAMAPIAVTDNGDEFASANPSMSEPTPHPSAQSWYQGFRTSLRDALGHTVAVLSSAMTRTHKLVEEKGYARAIYAILKGGSWDVLVSIFRSLGDMIGASDRSEKIDEGQMRVSTFYALFLDDNVNVSLSLCTIATAFGAIHCAGWALVFPSPTEAWIWRISSIAISVTPLLWALGGLFSLREDGAVGGPLMKKFTRGLKLLFWLPGVVMLPIYVPARILLLVEAFISLRTLTHGALAVVKWTSFLPHI